MRSDPENAKGFAAVAYFFAKELRATQKVPIAVIAAPSGAIPIKTWMSLASIRQGWPIAKTLAEWETALVAHNAVKNKPEPQAAYLAAMKEWETNVEPAYKAAHKSYDADVATAKAATLSTDLQRTIFVNRRAPRVVDLPRRTAPPHDPSRIPLRK